MNLVFEEKESALEPWKLIWRKGILPNLNYTQLVLLQEALKNNDPNLIQKVTLISVVQELPCCPIAYTHRGIYDIENEKDLFRKADAIEEYFADICFKVDQMFGDPASIRYFLNWWDDGERTEVFSKLLEEVTLDMYLYNKLPRVVNDDS